jgi:isocitrate dehydrogenase (NAD+)
LIPPTNTTTAGTKITLLPGDGIGPEITAAVVKILEAAGSRFVWERYDAGEEAVRLFGTPLPAEVIQSIQRNAVCLKGPITTPVGKGFKSVNVSLRQTLDLYANLRPVKSLPGVAGRFGELDLVVVRENTEDLYSGLEHVVVPGVVESIKVITEKASTRIARFAFEYARENGRKRVTAVHKANIMKLSDGLFLDCFRKVSLEYPDITADDVIVDAACMKLAMDPSRFDVLLLENLYGDIISDLAAGLVGGLGVVPGANLGLHSAIFESVHGSAPDIAGQGIANPTALLLSATMMLRHVGELDRAARIERALHAALRDGSGKTKDLGGSTTTEGFAKAIIEHFD